MELNEAIPLDKCRRALRYNILKIQRNERCHTRNVRQLCFQVTRHQSSRNLYREIERLLQKQAGHVCRSIVDDLCQKKLTSWRNYSKSLKDLSLVLQPLEKTYIKRNKLKNLVDVGLEFLEEEIVSDCYLRFHLRNSVFKLKFNETQKRELSPLFKIARCMFEKISRTVPWECMCTDVQPIGCGTFGVVLKAQLATTEMVAVKVIQHKSMKKLMESKELDISLTTSDPSVVKCLESCVEVRTELPKYLLDAFEDSSQESNESEDDSDGKIYLEVILMEYCDTNLRTILEARNEGRAAFTNFEKFTLFTQVFKGLEYLHNWVQVIHRDLKPENILVKGKNFKICDFGLSTFAKSGEHKTSRTDETAAATEHTRGVGTYPYSAPELQAGTRYGTEVDLYSLGVIMLEASKPFKTVMELSGVLKQRSNCNTEADFTLDSVDPLWKRLLFILTDNNPLERSKVKQVFFVPFTLPSFIMLSDIQVLEYTGE